MISQIKTICSLSFRYLTTKNKESAITTIKRITFISIALASCALSLICAISKGLAQATYTKIQTIYPQVIIDAYGKDLATSAIEQELTNPKYQVAASAPQWYTNAMLTTPERDDAPLIIHLRGIEPAKESLVSTIGTKIIEPTPHTSLEIACPDNAFCIGQQLAEDLGVTVGDVVTLVYPQDQTFEQKKMLFETKDIMISAIFKTGIQDFDTRLVYCTATTFTSIFEDALPTQLYVKLTPNACEKTVIAQLTQELQLHVFSWEEMYESILSALKLEQYALFFILFFILLIASTSIISLLFMTIAQKERDIALMQVFGMPPSAIRNVFVCLSLFICTFAAITGQIIAYVIGYFLHTYKWISLPENVYYTTHLPIALDTFIFLGIGCCVVCICFIASLLPLKKLKNYKLANVIRNQTS